jgi:trehalose synthase
MISYPIIDEPFGLDDFASHANLAAAVQQLRDEAEALVPRLAGKRVWITNSTAKGGGVAEMLPKFCTVLTELGVDNTWFVIGADRPAFFDLTKNLHNLIHGAGTPELGEAERALFEDINRRNADEIAGRIGADDILVVHDPQPAALGAMIKERTGVPTVWRCHIGTEEHVEATRAAWDFLRPYVSTYDATIFTADEYIPSYLRHNATLICPAIDPLSDKNRELSAPEVMGVLCNAGLAHAHTPVGTDPYPVQAKRLAPDGTFTAATAPDEIGLGYRPIVTQISRWDRLKGWPGLMRAFALLKERSGDPTVQLTRLVLGGPDPTQVADDPEGMEVMDELKAVYASLPPAVQADIAVVLMPQHGLMINAIQRCSSLVVQNSIREGFGLTATEAMWKALPVLGTHAVGLRTQITDGVHGRLVRDPEDPTEIADALERMLADADFRHTAGLAAQKRVFDEYLLFKQVRDWLEVLADLAG